MEAASMNYSGLILLLLIAGLISVGWRRYGKKMHLPGGNKSLWALVIIVAVVILLIYGGQTTPHTPVR
jgi:hypothetical protein